MTNKTPEVTLKYIKKYIYRGQYIRGRCILDFAKKNHLTTKEATQLIDKFVSDHQKVVDQEIENSLHPHRHYLLIFIIDIILGIYIIAQDDTLVLSENIGLALAIGFIFFFITIIALGVYDTSFQVDNHVPPVTYKKTKKPKKPKKKRGVITCPLCGSQHVYMIDDGYEKKEVCYNPDHLNDPGYYFSAQHYFNTNDYLDPLNVEEDVKTHKEVWVCDDCGHHWKR